MLQIKAQLLSQLFHNIRLTLCIHDWQYGTTRYKAFFADLGRIYNEEVMALADLGCRYLQIDDTNFAYLCDPIIRESIRRRGDDPDRLLAIYADLINACIVGRPADMAVCVQRWNGSPLMYGDGLPGIPSVIRTLPSVVHLRTV